MNWPSLVLGALGRLASAFRLRTSPASAATAALSRTPPGTFNRFLTAPLRTYRGLAGASPGRRQAANYSLLLAFALSGVVWWLLGRLSFRFLFGLHISAILALLEWPVLRAAMTVICFWAVLFLTCPRDKENE